MSTPLFGDTQGLNAREIQALKELGRATVPQTLLITRDLAQHLSHLSAEVNRKLGLIINRNGQIECVVLGTADRAYLPDIGRSRAGIGRLRGIRLVLTSLYKDEDQSGPLITNDEMTDLVKLRLDYVVSIAVSAVGAPARVEFAHIIASFKSVETVRNIVKSIEDLPTDADALLRDIEVELRQTGDKSRTTNASPAILVHIDTGERDAEERKAEMLELCRSAGIDVVRIVEQRRQKVDPKTLLGSGKLQELELHALDEDAEYIIFDRELTPSQTRAISRILPVKMLDRTQLILDIFAQHAQSLDGKLQVELAQLKYNLPKLADRDTAMSRLTGGIGGRGPGETKLEVNRRKARDRMHALEASLNSRASHRQLQRKRRTTQEIPIFSLVGYTNAGKSTLLNALTKSDVFCEDKLFATLDTTSRRLRFPRIQEVIFTDTVGFIRDLPTDLVAAFKATLEELEDASVLLHVIDASSPQVHSQIAAVENILKQLKLDGKPMIRILNKADLLDPLDVLELSRQYDAIAISAKYQTSTLPLIDEIQSVYLDKEKPNHKAEIRILRYDN